MREAALGGGARARGRRRRSDWGWIDVTAVRLSRGDVAARRPHPPPPLRRARRWQPRRPDGDGGAAAGAGAAGRDDQRRDRVDARRSRAPSRARAPSARYFFLAQWFPKIGVLEDAGWNCHQFHAGTEFFADYGVYDVRMTVPKGWVVGATGLERERRDNADGTTTHTYSRSEDVHDFAWTTSPDYVERTARFEHPALPPVDMRLLLQPEHAGQAERHFDATRAALRYYGEWFGAYPYGHITIVDPGVAERRGRHGVPDAVHRRLALARAGRRHARPRASRCTRPATSSGTRIVGNNEFEDAWMDEGFNTFSTGAGDRGEPGLPA